MNFFTGTALKNRLEKKNPKVEFCDALTVSLEILNLKIRCGCS